MFTELLAPAGDIDCFKQALYNGCDAIYLATERFGARAYAKNLTLEELKYCLSLAHELNKKIYVTVNTELKENEIEDCKEYIKTLYEMGVDGLILADFSMINYVIEHCPSMEAHISTQAGIKDLNDVHFFSSLGAHRCVLAREVSIDEIKHIKESSSMPIEIFAHGALCVSYSGGCLFSSMLTLRSGNRGRCAQNCRRKYKLYKDGNFIEEAFHLSMRDLNTSSSLHSLKEIGVDSLKIEGRMKDPDYVKIVISEYRKKLDDKNYNPKGLDNVFHRNYTKGFLFNEDKGNICDITKANNEGALIGVIEKKVANLTLVSLTKDLQVGDRIRIASDEDYFFTIDSMYDLSKNEINKSNKACYLNIYKTFDKGSKIYKMVDSSIELSITNEFKKGIVISCYGKVNEKLVLETEINGIKFSGESSSVFSLASSRPIDNETLSKQLKKLQDTSLYLDKIDNHIEGNLFMTISSINEARRQLVSNITSYFQNKRFDFIDYTNTNPIDYPISPIMLTAFCTTKAQYDICTKYGLDAIYYDDNYTSYVNPEYHITKGPILIGSYGGIYYNKLNNKDEVLVSDYSFNVCNSDTIHYLHKCGVDIVTISLEMSYSETKEILASYKSKFNTNPNIEIIVYGHQNLMTLKYCPLRKYGECGKCLKHEYVLEDSYSKFLTSRKNCITHIYNEKALNLIDNLNDVLKLTNRVRLQFTTEDEKECERIIKMYKDKLNNPTNPTSYFDSKKETRGYFKREIL